MSLDILGAVARPKAVVRPAVEKYRLWQPKPNEDVLEEFTAKIMVREDLEFRKAYNKKVYSRVSLFYDTSIQKGPVRCTWGPEKISIDVSLDAEVEEIRRQACEEHCPDGHGPALYHKGKVLLDGLNLRELGMYFGSDIEVVFVKEEEWSNLIPIVQDDEHRYELAPRTMDPEFWCDVVNRFGWNMSFPRGDSSLVTLERGDIVLDTGERFGGPSQSLQSNDPSYVPLGQVQSPRDESQVPVLSGGLQELGEGMAFYCIANYAN